MLTLEITARTLPYLLLGYLAGQWLAQNILVSIIMVCATLGYLLRQVKIPIRKKNLLAASILAIATGALLGTQHLSYSQIREGQFQPAYSRLSIFTGEALESPKISGKTQSTRVRLSHGETILLTTDSWERIEAHDTISFQCVLTDIVPIQSNGSTIPLDAIFKKKGIERQCRTYEVSRLSRENHAAVASLEQKIAKTVHEPNASLINGIVIGTKGVLPKELENAYRAVGLSHILVLSGFNVSMMILVLNLMLVRYSKTLTVILSLTVACGFVYITNFQVSVLRAVGMMAVAMVAGLLGRNSTAFRALLYVVTAMAIHDPEMAVGDTGFHLSVLATGGLVLGADKLHKFLQNTYHPVMASLLSATICASLATLPVTLMQFHAIAGWSLLANLLVLPVVLLISYGGLITLLIHSWFAPIDITLTSSLWLLSELANTITMLIYKISPVSLAGNGVLFVLTVLAVLTPATIRWYTERRQAQN